MNDETIISAGEQSQPVSTSSATNVNTNKKSTNKKLWIILGALVAALLVGTAFWLLKDVIFSPGQEKASLDLIPVQSGDKWGYVDRSGKYVINPQFESADFFHDGLAMIETSDDKVGFINKKGIQVIPAEYKEATPFSNGLAFVVAEGGAPTCIDKSGETKFTLTQAEYVFPFSEGLALFVVEEKDKKGDMKYKIGYVDKKGKIVISPQFEKAASFSDGLAAFMQGDKIGFIDKKGKIVINPQFDQVTRFKNGFAAFCNGDQWGFIDKKGRIVINPQFAQVGEMNENLAAIQIGDMWGYCDKEGKIIINPQFEDASIFGDGLARICQNKRWGYVNKKGAFEINPQFDYATDFYDGIAFVELGDKYGIINKKGEYIANPQFDRIHSYSYAVESLGIQSNYFDLTAFTKNFSKLLASGAFDGFSAGATLRTVLNHSSYSSIDLEKNDYVYELHSNEEIALDDGISIEDFKFNFSERLWERVYDSWWDDSFSKKYNYNAPLVSIECEFTMSEHAAACEKTIAKSIKNQMESKYKVTFEEIEANGWLAYYCERSDDMSFLILEVAHSGITIKAYVDHQVFKDELRFVKNLINGSFDEDMKEWDEEDEVVTEEVEIEEPVEEPVW